ncbi:unnamed protein product [Lepidochelys olivacea]
MRWELVGTAAVGPLKRRRQPPPSIRRLFRARLCPRREPRAASRRAEGEE